MLPKDDLLAHCTSFGNEELHMFYDPDTGLQAVVSIYNTNLGPALGGCRWLSYDSTLSAALDAIKLGQGMAYKSALAELPLGGGKAVLLKPNANIDPRKYFTAFARFVHNLNGRYITAVDSGTSTSEMDIIAKTTPYVCCTTVGKYSHGDPSPVTAFGVQRALEATAKFVFNTNSLQDLHIAILGLGHVGSNLAMNLAKVGSKLSICDIDPDKVDNISKKINATAYYDYEKLMSLDCDIIAPCALGAILNPQTIPKIKSKAVVGAANNQLASPEDADLLVKHDIVYVPDFVVNAGGLIYVAGQYMDLTEEKTLKKVSKIYDTTLNILQRANSEKINSYKIATKIAIERIYK